MHLLPDGKDGVLLETGAFKLPVGHWFVNEIGYGIATYNNKYFFRRFEIVEEETDA